MKKIERFEASQLACESIIKFAQNNSVSYMDSFLHYCTQNEVEIEYVAGLVAKNQLIKSKLQEEAENLNFLKKTARLPI